jgi:hypothetical protein
MGKQASRIRTPERRRKELYELSTTVFAPD